MKCTWVIELTIASVELLLEFMMTYLKIDAEERNLIRVKSKGKKFIERNCI